MLKDIYISCDNNGAGIIKKGSVNIEYSFEWLIENYTRIVFIGRLSAELFISKCDQCIKSMKVVRRGNVISWKCSMSSLCTFSIVIKSNDLNASRSSGHFVISKFCPHDHSVESIPEGRVSKEEERIIRIKKKLNELKNRAEGYRSKLESLRHPSSIKKYKALLLQCEFKIRKKESLLKDSLDIHPDHSEFYKTYGFDGFSDNNEKAYQRAIKNLSAHSLEAIILHRNRYSNHRAVINAAKEYNSERDEGICYTIPNLIRSNHTLKLNISLNQPLSKKGRGTLVSAAIQDDGLGLGLGCTFLPDDENENVQDSGNEGITMSYKDLNGGSDDNVSESDFEVDIEDEVEDPNDYVISDVEMEIERVLRANPINIEALENDFDKKIKIDSTKLRNTLYHLYFVKYSKFTRHYSSISRDGYRELKRNSSKRLYSVNDYYKNFDSMISKDAFRKDNAIENNENLKKNYCLYNIDRLCRFMYWIVITR